MSYFCVDMNECILCPGLHNEYGSPVKTIDQLKADFNVDVYTIGIGSQVDDKVLREMASPDQYQRLKTIDDLESLTNMLLNGSVGKLIKDT